MRTVSDTLPSHSDWVPKSASSGRQKRLRGAEWAQPFLTQGKDPEGDRGDPQKVGVLCKKC